MLYLLLAILSSTAVAVLMRHYGSFSRNGILFGKKVISFEFVQNNSSLKMYHIILPL